MTTEITDKVKELHDKLTDCLSMVKLGAAGRMLYFDSDQQKFSCPALPAAAPFQAHKPI
ncbi:unnamed protein product [marine sediment metagenome]|uniref:Uncharacterized protein n=1 Tax=marine sediment metagenome TaxID=412755 RepID=X1CK06_9ZZZZ